MEVEKFINLSPQLAWGLKVAWMVIIVVAWTMAWKGAALWKSARAGKTGWFVFFLIVNTLGILEILYIFVLSKKMGPIKNR